MTDSLNLEEFLDEIRMFEDDWYAHHGIDGRIIGSTIWDANRDELRAIEERHGITKEDPRVYSITGYRRDVRLIEDEWLSTCNESEWTDIRSKSPQFQEYWKAYNRFLARRNDCRGRHFPRLSMEGPVDTLPGLWACITEIEIPVIESLKLAGSLAHKRDGLDPELQHVYSLMHELKIPWAPKPPYPSLNEQETIDALRQMANRLEREDEEYYANVSGASSVVVEPEPNHNTALLEQWKFALANWKESLQTIRGRFEALNRDYSDLYALQRSWPGDEAQRLNDFLMSRCRFEEMQFRDLCPKAHELSWLLPVHARQLPLSGVYLYRDGTRHEAIFLYGDIAGWRSYHQIVHELMHLIARTVRGYPWPFGKKPSIIDMSTWPRLVFDACHLGQLPYVASRLFDRDDENQDGFFQMAAIQLAALSAQTVNPLILAVEHAAHPGPKVHNWPTAVVKLDDTIGIESRLIWQPIVHLEGGTLTQDPLMTSGATTMKDELPERIWTVQDYHQAKEFYEKRGLVFNPALEEGSPAAYHFVAQARLQAVERKVHGEADEKSTEFDTFLSHNSQDKPIIRQLADALVARGLRPWLDDRELVPGRPWQQALEEIIQTTKTAVVAFGPAGLGPWEEPEMRACLSEFVNRKLPVIPVLLPGAPQQPELPLFLKALAWVDLRGGLNDDGLDRLVWGITSQKPASMPSPAGSAPQSPVTTQSASGPLATWKKKLEFLQIEEAKATNAAQKFELQEQISEAKEKIRELGE